MSKRDFQLFLILLFGSALVLSLLRAFVGLSRGWMSALVVIIGITIVCFFAWRQQRRR